METEKLPRLPAEEIIDLFDYLLLELLMALLEIFDVLITMPP